MRMRNWLAFAWFLSAAVGFADDPEEERIRALVRQLDDDDAIVRDAATSRLLEVGPGAIPALEAGAGTGSPEAKARVARLIHLIRRKVILDRQGNEGLRDIILAELTGEALRVATHDWIVGGRRAFSLAESCMGLLQFDPDGPEARAAFQALNQLLGAYDLAQLAGATFTDLDVLAEFKSAPNALEQVRILFKGRDVAISPEASTIL